MTTSDKVIFKMLANIYLLRKSINTNFTIILMPLSLTLHNYDKFLWYKSYVPSKYIYITPTWLKYCTVLHPLLECWNPPVSYSLRPIFFVLFEKSNFLRKHHLLFCLPFKNVQVSKTILKKIYQKI